MSTRHPAALRLVFVFAALGACSSDPTDGVFPEEDASALEDLPLTFDVPADTRLDASTDRGTTDRGTADRGTTETTVCPASCTVTSECDPCRTSGTPSTVAYCCISGLCVSMTGTCPTASDGGMGDAANDAANDAADDAADPTDDTPDPTDDTPPDPEDDAGPPAEDVVSDLGGGDSAGDAGADASTDDATVVDAAVAMDAADGSD